MWKSYIAELLGLNARPDVSADCSSFRLPNAQGMQAKLVKADFHGSIISGMYNVNARQTLNDTIVKFDALKIQVLLAALESLF